MTTDYESLAEQVALYTTPAELDMALAMMNQARIRSSPIDTTQVIHLLSIGYRAGKAQRQPVTRDPFAVSSIDVERRSRFQYVVILRIPRGIDMCVEPPSWFRWTAMRQARRKWREEWQRQHQGDTVVASLAVDITSPQIRYLEENR